MFFSKPAAGNTVHYILKCSPERIRVIRNHGDVVCLKWERYPVRDRYHAFNCFHCQRYGHTERDCKFKRNGDAPSCAKCIGDHKTKDYTSNNNFKCINCVRHSRNEVDHIVNNNGCLSLESELVKTKEINVYGF